MSSEQLMQQARDIETTAAEVEYRQVCRAAGRGAVVIDYEQIQAKYQNRVQPLFEPFTRIPDPRSYNGAIDSLESAMSYLSSGYQSTDPITKRGVTSNGDLSAIESAAGELIDWQGEGATKFKINFIDPLSGK